MLLRRFLPMGLLVGLLSGVAIALLVPRTRAQSPPSEPVGVLRQGKAVRPADGELRLRVTGARARLVQRRADPDGGPVWALRIADVALVVPKAFRRRGTTGVVGHDRCVQAVRLVGGRPGWLDQRGTWRPVRFAYTGAPLVCESRSQLVGHATLDVFTTLRYPGGEEARARLVRGVAFGVLPAGSSGMPRVAGRAASVDRRSGAFLALAAPSLDRDQVRLDVRARDGARVPSPAEQRPGAFQHPRLVARAPDPAGGLPYAAFTAELRRPAGVRPRSSTPCVGSGPRIVEGRMGGVDAALGTFRPLETGGGGGCGVRLTRALPINLGWGGGDDPQSPANDAGLVTRRLQPGRTSVYGTALAAVRTVTIATPRDVRTLVPSGPAHAFIAVYDGTFPSGELVVTAHLDDGKDVVQRESLGFP